MILNCKISSNTESKISKDFSEKMGNVICCCWRMFCCECTLCEKKDDWNIDQECRPGEKAAGWLYKRAKSSAMWSKRYFAISNNKLLYYTERDRLVCKGEIVLAGALASVSTTRADTRKKFFFTISHPQCGVRELYAKTRNRRRQWIERINEISTQLMSRAVFGKLLKQGGLGKNIWQERWCICVGGTIDYFENATDNQSKGSIGKHLSYRTLEYFIDKCSSLFRYRQRYYFTIAN